MTATYKKETKKEKKKKKEERSWEEIHHIFLVSWEEREK